MSNPEDPIGSLMGGKYRLRELIAEGGMGRVYGARHEGTGRLVAVKVLRPELAVRWDIVRRSAREARLAVAARHPNVVEVLDAGEDASGARYLVLERLYGQTLEDHLSKPLLPLTAAQALVPIMNALCALHDSNIVHRDIKPSNLFLSLEPNGLITPKLLDFGVAKALDSAGSTRTGSALGTPAYMAPEQALGAPASPAADVWSMAVVWVRALTGQLPFTEGALLSRLRAGQAPSAPTPALPPLSHVLGSALAIDPGERFAHMRDFRAALLAALEQVDASQHWPGPLTISLAPEETALAGCIRAATPSATPARRARAALDATQTLRGTASALLRSKRWWLPAAIAASLCFAVTPWFRSLGQRSERALESSPPIQPDASSAAPPPLQPALTIRVATSDEGMPSAVSVSVSRDAVPNAARTTPSARRERRQHSAPAAAPRVAPPDATRRAPALGTNRAPIIELP